jgi:TonB family protein
MAVGDNDDIVVRAPRRPIWVRTPSPRRLSALYPERALDRGREGEARLHCIIGTGGTLDCERVSETPGFGSAAVRVAHTFRHAETLADGSSAIGTPVNLRVIFRIDDDPRSNWRRG